MSNQPTLPQLMEGYGRKRKKRTSIETNIKLTLEKRFGDVRGIILNDLFVCSIRGCHCPYKCELT